MFTAVEFLRDARRLRSVLGVGGHVALVAIRIFRSDVLELAVVPVPLSIRTVVGNRFLGVAGRHLLLELLPRRLLDRRFLLRGRFSFRRFPLREIGDPRRLVGRLFGCLLIFGHRLAGGDGLIVGGLVLVGQLCVGNDRLDFGYRLLFAKPLDVVDLAMPRVILRRT